MDNPPRSRNIEVDSYVARFKFLTNTDGEACAEMIELSEVRFRWHHDAALVLDIPKFEVKAGERIFLEGPSGCGKTTLLNVLGGVVVPENGSVKVNGTEITQLNSAKRDAFRADHIGIIFQMFNLIPYLSPIDNITLPCRFSRQRHAAAQKNSGSVEEEARRLLTQMQLPEDATKNFSAFELSTGQQQRVAAARALIGAPALIIADEPTSALDHDVRQTFINLLFNEITGTGTTLLFVSHAPDLAEQFDCRIKLSDINEANQK